jgi:hypothetical protein
VVKFVFSLLFYLYYDTHHCPGTFQNKNGMFHITRRRFFHFPESTITSKWCTSPLFTTSGAKGSGALSTKFDVFCVRPALNPVARVMDSLPVALGLPARPGCPSSQSPYTPATLNYVGTDDGFSALAAVHLLLPILSVWRARFVATLMSSSTCIDCIAHAASGCCSFYGARDPPPWVAYKATRKPEGIGRAGGFIDVFCQGMLTNGFAGSFKDRIQQIGWFVNKVLHRVNGVAKAVEWVTALASGTGWVELFVRRELKLFKGTREEFWESLVFRSISSHLEKADWHGRKAIPLTVSSKGEAEIATWKSEQRIAFLNQLRRKQ